MDRLHGAWREVAKAYRQSGELWISDATDADEEYGRTLTDLKAGVERWNREKGAIEEQWSLAAGEAARAVEAVAPDVAEKLHAAAAELKRARAEGFGGPTQ